jgi:flagellar assembly protein FliH
MSTSFSPALEPEREPEIQPFPYVEAQEGNRAGLPEVPGGGGRGLAGGPSQAGREESLRQMGRQEGEAAARAGYEEQLARVRDGVRVALEDFARERTNYYRGVEAEVVQLALSIARKILHREAQVDPLLLAGVVRVALDQIEDNTKVVVRVHPQQAADARGFFAKTMDPQRLPEVVEDGSVQLDGCVLQTELGTTELGIEAQFKEIEQGLMDLLAQRPQAGG